MQAFKQAFNPNKESLKSMCFSNSKGLLKLKRVVKLLHFSHSTPLAGI